MHLRALTLFVLAATASCRPQVSAKAQGLLHTDSGVRIVDAGETLEVTAIRSDVIRVRVYRQGEEPENTSFAVLGQALHRIEITHQRVHVLTGHPPIRPHPVHR